MKQWVSGPWAPWRSPEGAPMELTNEQLPVGRWMYLFVTFSVISPAVQLGRNTANVKSISGGKVLLKPFSGSPSPSQNPLQEGSLCFQNFSSTFKWLLSKKKTLLCWTCSSAALVSFFGKKIYGFGYNSTSVLAIRLWELEPVFFLFPGEFQLGAWLFSHSCPVFL